MNWNRAKVPFRDHLYYNLTLRYILFLIAAVVATVIFIFHMQQVVATTSLKYKSFIADAKQSMFNISYNHQKQELRLPQSLAEDTWVEILKDNQVVFVQGNKLDDKQTYSQKELASIINSTDAFGEEINMNYQYIPFQGDDGENYICLIKHPAEEQEWIFGILLPENLRDSGFEKELDDRIHLLFGIFLLFMLGIILLFSWVTFIKIIKPLQELNDGLQRVMKSKYDTRLQLKDCYEFNQIKEAFNTMVEKLDLSEKENKIIAESKKRLLLDLSHDLKTPATTVQGYAYALYSDMVEKEHEKKYQRYIYEKSKYMTDLIDKLYQYSKLESRVYDLNKKQHDLCEFLRNVLIGFYGEISAKEFELEVVIPEKKIWYLFDALEVERALANIISNMLKYNDPHTKLCISLTEIQDEIILSIADNGVGIGAELQETVFHALVRGDCARKADGGLGLGLSIAKRIIELHGATLSLNSELGNGSEFIIRFLGSSEAS